MLRQYAVLVLARRAASGSDSISLSLACAGVTACLPAPRDSRAGPRWFERGVPRPSASDDAQMRRIAADLDYHCPVPLLLLIGGNATRRWQLAAFVYPTGTDRIPLRPVACGRGGDVILPRGWR
jgi:hypothetical protein